MQGTNSVFKKIHAINKQGLYVQKTGYNDHHGYNYATEADVLVAVRDRMNEHGLIYHFSVLESEQVKDDVVRITYEFTIIDVETGDRYTSTVVGDGHDRTDKAPYKAFTGAQKYFFMKLFMIATGDDPENEKASYKRNDDDSKEEKKVSRFQKEEKQEEPELKAVSGDEPKLKTARKFSPKNRFQRG